MMRSNVAVLCVVGAASSIGCGGPVKPATDPSSMDASDASGIDPASTRKTGTSTANPPDLTGTNTGAGTGTDGNAPAGTAPVSGTNGGSQSGTGSAPGTGVGTGH